MIDSVQIGKCTVGPSHPIFVIAEVGINHNGDLAIAKRLIDTAVMAGCDAVKFQKRTPDLCVPDGQHDIPRETPWGVMSYLEYRHRIEFGDAEYAEIDTYCRDKDIIWFASCWDEPAVEFIERFKPPCHKVASACLTDRPLLERVASTGLPVILSTGMSTMEEIRSAVSRFNRDRLLVAHTTSAYPCRNDQLNLQMIPSLAEEFDVPIGYSGHEIGLQVTVAAVALGACFVERHITLDRAMWGSDQAASVEPWGLTRLVRDVRVIEQALGNGVKQVYPSELGPMKKLRRVDGGPAE